MLPNCMSAALRRRMRKKPAPPGDFTQKNWLKRFISICACTKTMAVRAIFKSQSGDLKFVTYRTYYLTRWDVFPAGRPNAEWIIENIVHTILISSI